MKSFFLKPNKFFYLSLIIILSLALLAYLFLFQPLGQLKSNKPMEAVSSSKPLKIVTTLFPLYDMAKNLGGDEAQVSLLLPPGIEPHSFEPSSGDLVKINEADIFIYTGNFMEPWAQDIINGSRHQQLIIVDASYGIDLQPSSSGHETNSALDPHIWLDFDRAIVMVKNISSALIAKDPARQDFYLAQEDKYISNLKSLDNQYKLGLKDCSSRAIIYGGHYAFGYLAARYQLNYQAAQGISPDSEPTARDLALLVDQINKQGIKYIFYEELSSPKIAETLSSETGAKLLPLNAAHNLSKEELASGLSFSAILQADLMNLRLGLGCR